ncbi:MAG: 2-dehydropantoate 2-reductase [Paraglaciecola sp.]|jgi:2-dehydropantoate 2-reductase
MKIAILGNGAIGNLLALKCHQLHQSFTLLMRKPAHFNLCATDRHGLEHNIPIKVAGILQAQQFDLLILPVKAYQVLPALQQMANSLTGKQTLVLLHNGMGLLEKAQGLLPHIPLIAATTSHAAYKPAVNQLHETGIGTTHCGFVTSPEGNAQQAIVTLLDELLAPCTWHPNINAPLWQKLAINAVINPLTALQQIKNGQLARPEYSSVITDICFETASVMQACGYPTTATALVKAVNQVIQSSADNYSSMFQDILYQRKTEIDFINGYIVAQGQKLGIDTPINLQLTNDIHYRETL